MVVRRARLVPRIVLPWRVVICALGHDVSCSLALANPVWGDGHYRPSCAPRPRLPSAHRSPSHGPGPPCPPPNPVGRGRILLLEILQITLSAEPFLAAVGVPPADGAGLTMNTADWWSCASDIVCGLDLRAKDRVSVRSPGPATAHAISLTNTLDLFSPDVY